MTNNNFFICIKRVRSGWDAAWLNYSASNVTLMKNMHTFWYDNSTYTSENKCLVKFNLWWIYHSHLKAIYLIQRTYKTPFYSLQYNTTIDQCCTYALLWSWLFCTLMTQWIKMVMFVLLEHIKMYIIWERESTWNLGWIQLPYYTFKINF